jgi:hypothetical protein
MASFETDLARHLAAYDRAERDSEIEREMTEDYDDYALNGEDATVIPGCYVRDAEVAHVWGYGSDHRVIVPGIWD